MTLWNVGDWFIKEYQAIGKSARCEMLMDSRGGDLADPDATLIVFIS